MEPRLAAAGVSHLLEDSSDEAQAFGNAAGCCANDAGNHANNAGWHPWRPSRPRRSQAACSLGTVAAAGLAFLALVTVAAMRVNILSRSHPRASAARSSLGFMSLKAEEHVMEDDLPDCRDAEEGSACYMDVTYARDHIKDHPDWYVGLHRTSSFKTVQAFMHNQHTADGGRRCPRPCGVVEKAVDQGHHAQLTGKCHTSQRGEECYNHVMYTMKENLPKHPEWYPGLAKDADFKVTQDYLHVQGVCPKPCNLKADKKKHKKDPESKCNKLSGNKKLECLAEVAEESSCHTAIAGEACYGDILWAKDHLAMHGEWYKGLTVNSTFDEIQAFLSEQHNADVTKLCPKPCNRKAVEAIRDVNVKSSCATARVDSKCYKSVLWVISDGIDRHPEWYVNLTKNATFEEVQSRLVKNKDKHCQRDPCPCQTAQEGDKCYGAIEWVRKVGIVNHSSWYKGLDENSTMEAIQNRLHEDKHPLCGLPCQRTPWLKYNEDGEAIFVEIS